MPPSRIKEVLGYVSEHLETAYPSFRILHTDPRAYYEMGHVAYTRSEQYLYIKIRIALSTSKLLFHVYAVNSIRVITGRRNNSYTTIQNLPLYLADTSDYKFFTELVEAAYQSCTGGYFKQCPSSLKIFQSPTLTCSSALFLNNIQFVYDRCEISLQIDANMNQTYVLDLDDDKILITTQIKDWVETCSDLPPRIFEGCSNRIVQRKCSCSLQVGKIYIRQSIQAWTLLISVTLFQFQIILPFGHTISHIIKV